MIMLAFCIRVVNNYFKKQSIDAEILKKKTDRDNSNLSTHKKLNETDMITITTVNGEQDPQYDANQDFLIFGKRGSANLDKPVSLASKLNFADKQLCSFAMTTEPSAAVMPSSSNILPEDREISDE